jgi:hypothetical protein
MDFISKSDFSTVNGGAKKQDAPADFDFNSFNSGPQKQVPAD